MNNNNQRNPLVSIVVPMYNSEKYILECINSVISQTYFNWELILVDDGSTDSTFLLCDCQKDSRIKLIKLNENKGPGISRNIGIENANGEYLTFLDSDDYFDKKYLETVLKYCFCDYDVITTNYTYFKNKKKIPVVLNSENVELFFNKPYEIFLSTNRVHSGPWAKLYKRKFLIDNRILFPNFKCREDIYFENLVFCYTTKAILTNENGYFVRIRKNSLEGGGFRPEQLVTINACELAVDLCSKHHPELIHISNSYLIKELVGLMNSFCKSKKQQIEIKQKIDMAIKKHINICDDVKNKNNMLLFLHSFKHYCHLLKRKIIFNKIKRCLPFIKDRVLKNMQH